MSHLKRRTRKVKTIHRKLKSVIGFTFTRIIKSFAWACKRFSRKLNFLAFIRRNRLETPYLKYYVLVLYKQNRKRKKPTAGIKFNLIFFFFFFFQTTLVRFSFQCDFFHGDKNYLLMSLEFSSIPDFHFSISCSVLFLFLSYCPFLLSRK